MVKMRSNVSTERFPYDTLAAEQDEIDKRVLEYNVFASCKYDCPVISFVIYFK
jgi:hypothetical protein